MRNLWWTFMRKKNGQKKRMANMRMLILFYKIQLVTPNICTEFQNRRRSSCWEMCGEKFYLRKKKNEQIKEMISTRMLNLSNTKQVVIPNVCTRFQNPRCSSSWVILDTNFPTCMHYIGVRDGKKEKGKKKAKIILASWFSFTQYTSILCKCI